MSTNLITSWEVKYDFLEMFSGVITNRSPLSEGKPLQLLVDEPRVGEDLVGAEVGKAGEY